MKNNLHEEVLSSQAYDLLKSICSNASYKSFYLAGGTALALQLGHRKSIDLDLFSPKEFKSTIIKKLNVKYDVISLHDNSIELIVNDTKLFFFFFAFPLTRKLIVKNNTRLAHPLDIGLMKLLSLQGRSARKDIIDLFFIDKRVMKLEKLLDTFEKHYPRESFNSYDSLKSLIDIETLDAQPMPKMLKKCSWDECFAIVKQKVSSHIRRLVL